MREAVAGRANVEDTPELLAYYDELEKLEAGALWTVANKIEPWVPAIVSVPVLWRYAICASMCCARSNWSRPRRRDGGSSTLTIRGRRDVSAAVGWLYSGLQVMHPGEVASAHAHSASALRFIMEGEGAYTIVDGHKMTLGAQRLRADAERHLARAWRRGAGHAVHLAGWARHSARQRAGGEFLRRASEWAQETTAIRSTTSTHTWGNPGLMPATGTWSKATRRC